MDLFPKSEVPAIQKSHATTKRESSEKITDVSGIPLRNLLGPQTHLELVEDGRMQEKASTPSRAIYDSRQQTFWHCDTVFIDIIHDRDATRPMPMSEVVAHTWKPLIPDDCEFLTMSAWLEEPPCSNESENHQ